MKKLLGFAILCAISSGCVHAQQTFNSVRMKAPTNGGTVGSTDYYENGNVYRVRVQAGPSGSLTSNLNWKFPYTADSAGDCLVSLGGGQWNPGACGLTPPVTISGSTAGNILTVTQSGAGDAIRSNGPLYANGLTTLNDVVLLTGKKIQFTAGVRI